jgi:hypothetical protein
MVPTGIKTGVSIVPFFVSSMPVLAAVRPSLFIILNAIY